MPTQLSLRLLLPLSLLTVLNACQSTQQKVHQDMIAVLKATDLNRYSEHDLRGTPPITVEEQVKTIPIETQQLMIACAQGRQEELQNLLNAGHHPSETYPVMHDLPVMPGDSYTAPRSAFQFALLANQVETVKYLQTRYPELEWNYSDFSTICRCGHLEMAEYILSKTPQYTHLPKENIYTSALVEAVKSNNLALVKMLIAKGVPINEKDPSYYYNALDTLAASDNLEMAQYLLKQGAKNETSYIEDHYQGTKIDEWMENNKIKPQECLILSPGYNDKNYHLISQTSPQKFHLYIGPIENCAPFLSSKIKSILVLIDLEAPIKQKLQETLTQQGRSDIKIHTAPIVELE